MEIEVQGIIYDLIWTVFFFKMQFIIWVKIPLKTAKFHARENILLPFFSCVCENLDYEVFQKY